MNLREQKAHILRTIDGLLTIAPETTEADSIDLTGVRTEDKYAVQMRFYKKQDTVTIGAYRILNHKSALLEFKKRMKKYPVTPTVKMPVRRGPSIKPLNNRVTGFSGEYTAPYVPRKATNLIEMGADKTSAGFYAYGCFCNGAYGIRVPKPKMKRPLLDPPGPMEDMVNMDIGELEPAIFGKEKYYNPSGDTCNESLRLEVLGYCGPKIDVNPRYVDLILKHHPESEPYLSGRVLYMMTRGEVSGVVTRMWDGS